MKNNKFVALVLIPGFTFLIVFVFIPVVYGLGISFFKYNPANTINPFIGIKNYSALLKDEVFWKALKNTVFFAFLTVALNIVITLFLAQIISVLESKKLKTFFRAILFIPCIAPMVGTAMVWKYGIVGTDNGLLNQIMSFLGLAEKNWFLTTTPMMVIVIIFTLWADMGYNVILFTAGLEGIPQEFEEAAKIDGAGPLQRFLKVKLPLMNRTFAFVAIMTMADYFKMFAQFQVFAPDGGRDNSLMVLTSYIYKTSFKKFDMGYASAVATVLFFVVFIVALVQNRFMRRDWSY